MTASIPNPYDRRREARAALDARLVELLGANPLRDHLSLQVLIDELIEAARVEGFARIDPRERSLGDVLIHRSTGIEYRVEGFRRGGMYSVEYGVRRLTGYDRVSHEVVWMDSDQFEQN